MTDAQKAAGRAHVDQMHALVQSAVDGMLLDLKTPPSDLTAKEDVMVWRAATIAINSNVDEESPYQADGEPIRNAHFLLAALVERVMELEKQVDIREQPFFLRPFSEEH